MSGHNKATSEQLSVHEGASYDKVFLSGHRPKEGLSWSSEREPSAESPINKEEDFFGDEVKEREGDENDKGEEENKGEFEVEDKDEDESDEGASVERSSGSPGDDCTHPFILPKIWTVNDFKPTMTANVFKNLWYRYQIPDHILIHLPRKFEKCYFGKTVDVGMYDAMFVVGLRLLMTALHCQLANF